MNNEENVIYCSRCGSPMNAGSRYCMKCGNLNENHPENDKYSKILKKTNKDNNYQIGSGKKLFDKGNNKSGVSFITEKNTQSVRLKFIIFNVIVIAILCGISLVPLLSIIDSFSLDAVLQSGVCLNLFLVGLFSIFFVSMQILFIKINEYWWASFIPFYNFYILSKVVFNKGWLFILMFIPGVNIIYMIVLYYALGKAFHKSGILTVILGPIMIAIISFGSSAYNGIYYVVDSSPNALEKTYGSYRRFAEFSIFILFIGGVGLFFSNNSLSTLTNGKDELSIIGGANIAINNVKKAIMKDKVTCYDENGIEVSIYTNGNYYFYSDDFLYDYSFKSNLIYTSNGYVKVVSNTGNFQYYVAYSADEYGIPETSKDELSADKVQKNLVIQKPNGIMCTID